MENVKVEVMTTYGNEKDVDPEKALEVALKKFRKEMENEDVLNQVRKRQYYEKPSAERHRKKVYAKYRANLSKTKNKNK